jgi:hypothetical protein
MDTYKHLNIIANIQINIAIRGVYVVYRLAYLLLVIDLFVNQVFLYQLFIFFLKKQSNPVKQNIIINAIGYGLNLHFTATAATQISGSIRPHANHCFNSLLDVCME